MTEAQTLAQELAEKTRSLVEFMGEHPSERKYTDAERDEILARNKELNDLEERRVKAAEIEGIAQKAAERSRFLSTPVDGIGHGASGERPQEEQKSLGEIVTQHPAFKNAPSRRNVSLDMPDYEFKVTPMTEAAGFPPYPIRTNIVIPLALRRPVVADLIPQDTMTQSAVIYVREKTFTNNAAVVAENAAKPDSVLEYENITANLGKIAHWIPVTEEQLADVPQARGLIDNRLTLGIQLAEEIELINGSGNIVGFLQVVGTQTQAKGGDPTPSAIYKAFNKIRFTGFAEPDGVVMHPNDWEPIRLLQDGVGRYIWGDPWVPGPEMIWGKPVVITPAETENTALVGAFGQYAHISRRQGITIKTTDSYSDYFIYNKLVILAEERLTLEIYRPGAFAKVTGI